MTDPVYVIAYNLAHAFEWAKSHGVETNRLRYVSGPEQLKGIRDVTVHVLPGAWEQNYRDQLMQELHINELTSRVAVVREGKVAA